MLKLLKTSFWCLLAITAYQATHNFYGVALGVQAMAQVNNEGLTTVGELITQQTELAPEEIEEAFAVEQRAQLVMIGVDTIVPIQVEGRLFYLVIRDSISGTWNYYYFDEVDWTTTIKPYLDSTDITAVTVNPGSDTSQSAQSLATLAAASNAYSGEQVANVLLYGGPNGPVGSPQLVPSPHVQNAPSLDAIAETDSIGSVGGQFRVSESGAATYSVPIPTAAGTAGVAPEIALNYSSSGSNGIAGMGWSLGGLSTISRCRRTLAIDGAAAPIEWDDTDVFCLDGQRLLLTSSNQAYGEAGSTYRTEVDMGAEITLESTNTHEPTSFKVEQEDGATYYYGLAPVVAGTIHSDTDALLKRATGDAQTLTWALKKIEDNVGNPIWFEYDTNTSRQLISEIRYAYGANQQSVSSGYGARVVFSYSTADRSDPLSGYVAGALFRTEKRLEKITSYNKYGTGGSEAEGVLREIRLTYQPDSTVASDNVSRLASLQQCRTTACTGETTFRWRIPTVSPATQLLDTFTMSNGNHILVGQTMGDIDGDGNTDLAWVEGSLGSDPADINPRLNYALSNGNEYEQQPFTGGNSEIIFDKVATSTRMYLQLVDYNLDGRADLFYFDHDSERWKIYLSKPQLDGTWRLSNSPITTSISHEKAAFIDINADGASDVVYRLGSDPVAGKLRTRLLLENPSALDSSSQAYFFGPEKKILRNGVDQSINGDIRSLSSDFNGDGRSDLLMTGYYSDGGDNCNGDVFCRGAQKGDSRSGPMQNLEIRTIDLYIFSDANNGSGDFNISQYASFSDEGNADYRVMPQRVHTVDINADGLSDLYYQMGDPSGNEALDNYFRLNRGDGSFTDRQPINENTLGADDSSEYGGVDQAQFVDWNMDGYPDLAWKSLNGGLSYIRYWDNTAGDYGTRVNFGSAAAGEKVSVFYPDVNGDGVADRVVMDSRTSAGRLSAYSRTSLIPQNYDHGYESGVYYEIGDVLNRAANRIDLFTNGFGASTIVDYEPLSASASYERLGINGSYQPGEQCETIDGPGNEEFCWEIEVYAADEGAFYSQLNGEWDLPDNAETIGKTSPVLEYNGAMYVVTRVESDNPSTSSSDAGNVDQDAKSAISYQYRQANMQAAGRGFLGFKQLITVDEQTGVKTTNTYRQDWPFIGHPIGTVVETAAGHTLSSSVSTWGIQGFSTALADQIKDSGSASVGPLVTTKDAMVESGYALASNGAAQGALLSRIETSSTYDSENNPLTISVVTKDGSGAIVKSVTTTSNYDNALPLREARLSSTSVSTSRQGFSGAEATKTRTSSFSYFTTGVKRGMLRTEVIEPETGAQEPEVDFAVTTTHDYDAFGNLNKSVVEADGLTRCDAITVEYDARGRYADKTYDCRGMLESETVSRNVFGAALVQRAHLNDSATVETTKAYSVMGIEYFSRASTGGYSINYQTTNVSNCPVGTAYKAISKLAGGAESQECFDKLGRQIRTLKRGFDGAWDAQDIEYDHLSRVKRRSEPFDLTGASSTATYWVDNSYDILDRVVFTKAADDSTASITYDGLTTTTTNDLNHTTTEEKNILGEVVAVEDHLGARTTYKHDHFGNLIQMTDNGNNVTTISYDALGRKISMDDPNKGLWTYKYNGIGELVLQTDAKGQETEMYYDLYGRMMARVEYAPNADGSGRVFQNNAVWIYQITSARGSGLLRLKTSFHTGFRKEFFYDQFGRTERVETTIDGSKYHAKQTYDQFGREFQSFDEAGDGSFDSEGIVNQYNSYGYVKAIANANFLAGDSLDIYREVLSMDARGNVTSERLGNGVTTSKGYDQETGRLESIFSSGSSGEVQDLRYQWDTVGNLKYRHEYSGSKTLEESFKYDQLNRLTEQTVDGEDTIFITYDDVNGKRLGNIASKTGVGNYVYGAGNAGPHAVTQAGGVTYVYDDNGNNVSSSDGRTIEYTTFDKPSLISKGGHTTEFVYDVDHSRFKRVDSSASGVTTTRYLGSVEVINRPDGTLEKKRYIAGTVIQTIFYGDNDIEDYREDAYTHKDHLGSLDVVTDASGDIVSELSFDAWGQRRNASNWQALNSGQLTTFDHNLTTRGYTGHEMLDEVGVIHMNGRIYDPRLARFLQADPIIQSPYNTQSLNRYSYVWNNPLNSTDPSGYISLRQALSIAVGAIVGYFTLGAGQAFAAHLLGQGANAVAAGAIAGAVSGAAAGFAGGLVATGTLEGAFSSALGGALSGAIFGAIGGHFKGANQGSSCTSCVRAGKNLWLKPGDFGKMVMAHSVGGGTLSVLRGGKFGSGFISAGIGKLATPQVLRLNNAGYELAASSLVGGTVSRISGGKFANGAATAAVQFTANALSSDIGELGDKIKTKWKSLLEKVKSSIDDKREILRDASITLAYAHKLGGEVTVGFSDGRFAVDGRVGLGFARGVSVDFDTEWVESPNLPNEGGRWWAGGTAEARGNVLGVKPKFGGSELFFSEGDQAGWASIESESTYSPSAKISLLGSAIIGLRAGFITENAVPFFDDGVD